MTPPDETQCYDGKGGMTRVQTHIPPNALADGDGFIRRLRRRVR